MNTLDVELIIVRGLGGTATAGLRAELPARRADLAAGEPIALDDITLRELSTSPDDYGHSLTEMVFRPRLLEAWQRVRGFAEGEGKSTRLRLVLDGDDALHALRWELLRDPIGGAPLAHSRRVRFSRFLSSPNLADVQAASRPQLRAVVAVASPEALPGFSLPPISVADEVSRARQGLGELALTVLDGREGRRAATLPAIAAALADGAHILYLVCHGQLAGGTPLLWLEREGERRGTPIHGVNLVQAITNLDCRPLLVIISSCQGAGDTYQTLAAIGPQLARAGVGAVIAMQGDMPMALSAQLVPLLFRELLHDGQIDRALAAARANLPESSQWWMPTLWMAVRDGALWRSPGDQSRIPDAEVVATYIKALARHFEATYRPAYTSLRLVRGTRAPHARSAEERSKYDRLQALRKRHFQAPADEGKPVLSVGEFQAQHRRVVLLGAPGSGKSTTLRHLVGYYGKAWLAGVAGAATPIPIFADLSTWDDKSLTLMGFLQRTIHRRGQGVLAARLPQYMASGRAVLLLDGLNEIPQLERHPITNTIDDPRVQAIAELGTREEWHDVGCVLSCRTREFSGGPDWHDLHILDLTTEQVALISEEYFRVADGSALAADFLRATTRSAQLRELVVSPFFLSNALFYFEQTRTIPESLAELLRFSVDLALERERCLPQAREACCRQLGHLALQMTAAGYVAALPRSQALAWLAQVAAPASQEPLAPPLLSAAEGAALLTLSDSELRFQHQIFQEYFAAHALHDGPLSLDRLSQVATPLFAGVWPLARSLDELPDGARLIAQVVSFLSASDAQARIAAADALRLARSPAAAEPLAAALDDADRSVRRAAALALAVIGDRRAVPALVEDLEADDTALRQQAAQSLRGLADPRAVEPLIRALAYDPDAGGRQARGELLWGRAHDAEAGVRRAAAEALGGYGDARALHPLVQALAADPDEEVRGAAAVALGELSDPRAIPDLLASLTDRNAQFPIGNALVMLGELAVAPLSDVLAADRDEQRRAAAAHLLARIRLPATIQALLAGLLDQAETVRSTCARGLGLMGELALGPLLGRLDSRDAEERRWAAWALGRLDDPRAVSRLIEALRAGPEESAEALARALSLSKRAAPEPLTKLLHSHFDDPQVRFHAALALGRVGEGGVMTLIAATQSPDPFLRWCAVGGLCEAADKWFSDADPRVVEALACACADPEHEIRLGAGMGLGVAGDPRAVPFVLEVLESGDEEQRPVAAKILGRIEDVAAIQALAGALGSPDPEVRKATLGALRE